MKKLLLIVSFIAASAGAFAQGAPATSTLMQGNVESGFLFAPDFKFTDVNGSFGTLAGGYGGWVIDRKFLVGAGIYTLAQGGHGTDMTYGGGVFEYFLNQGSLVNISVRGLIGGGSASVRPFRGFDRDFRGAGNFLGGIDFGSTGRGGGFVGDLFGRGGDRFDFDRSDPDLSGFDASTSFFVAEPELNVILNISEKVRFSVGGGYRFIGGAGRLSDRLDGFTASVALKLSFF